MSAPSVLAIVQARMGSARFPGKVLADLAGAPVVAHVLRRARATETPMDVVLAIPDTAENDALAAVGAAEGVRVYRGAEDDVLGRFYWAAETVPGASALVRLTGEDVFKDPALIDTLVHLFLAEWAAPAAGASPPHYMHLGGPTWPLGLDVEVFSRVALARAYREATDPADREHVTPWMVRTFGLWQLRNPWGRGSWADHWTVDTPGDLAFARAVYAKLYHRNPVFGFEAMMEAGYA
jgi:spore coat polysaccharide biosynthesis protein SpsF